MDLNLLQMVIDKPKIKRYLANQINIIRAGLSTNPVERFNFTSGAIFSNDALVKHGESFFIGGDTATHEFDFSTKIANSVVECPMRFFRTHSPSPFVPSDVSWILTDVQSDLDKLKSQDSTPYTNSTLTNLDVYQMMLELDLTPLCNSLFGGSNAALKAALKAINVDVWAMGSGSNASVLTNGLDTKWWNGTVWSNAGSTSSASIAKVSLNYPNPTMYVNSSNKFYLLIASQYASDGTIPSSVTLDYLNIKIDIARTTDTVQPITVNLPKYWAMVVKGFSPAWDNTFTGTDKCIMALYKDSQNKFEMYYANSDKKLYAYEKISNINSLNTFAQTFNKFQVQSILMQKTTNKLIVHVLLNNGNTIRSESATTAQLYGLLSMYLMSSASAISANAFAESFTLLDLQRMGKVRFGGELVSNGDFSNGGTGWIGVTSDWNFSSNKAVLTATAAYQNLVQQINNITPGGTYKLTADLPLANSNVTLQQFNNGGGTFLRENYLSVGAPELNITVGADCTVIKIKAQNLNVTTGTFTFDNISLKQILQDGLTDGEALSILKGQLHIKENNLVVNGDFSNGTTGWSPSTITGFAVTNNEASYTATAQYGQIFQGFNTVVGHKYYLSAYAKSLDLVQLKFVNGIKTSIGSGAYELLSGIETAIATNTILILMDIKSSGWNSISAKQFNAIDLTALFGAGLEPTLAQCDAMFAQGSTNPIALINPELFDINKVTLHANATRSNGVITLVASGTYQNSYLDIPVLPNNRYELIFGVNTGYSYGQYRYNNIILGDTGVNGSKIFTTPNMCNKVRVYLGNSITGTFTFSNISLKRKD